MELEMCIENCTCDCEMTADEMYCGEFCREVCGLYDLEDSGD